MAVIPFGHLTVLSSNQTEGMTPSSSRPFSTQTALTHIILYAWLSENKKNAFFNLFSHNTVIVQYGYSPLHIGVAITIV
jgi:hypothetical protein